SDRSQGGRGGTPIDAVVQPVVRPHSENRVDGQVNVKLQELVDNVELGGLPASGVERRERLRGLRQDLCELGLEGLGAVGGSRVAIHAGLPQAEVVTLEYPCEPGGRSSCLDLAQLGAGIGTF